MDKYFVWRRNDGQLGASVNGMPRDYVTGGVYETAKESAERRAKGLPLEGAGIPVTFEKIGEVENWDDARKMIQAERKDG